MAYLKYFFKILKHKYYVFIAGLALDVPLYRLLKHDMSKFSIYEFKQYTRYFSKKDNLNEFRIAWQHHKNHNDHHWQYWIDTDDREIEYIDMPEVCIKEMVADWLAAGKAYKGKWPDLNNWTWFNENYPKIKISDLTRSRLLNIIGHLGREW